MQLKRKLPQCRLRLGSKRLETNQELDSIRRHIDSYRIGIIVKCKLKLRPLDFPFMYKPGRRPGSFLSRQSPGSWEGGVSSNSSKREYNCVVW
jgi:hypothetical protein